MNQKFVYQFTVFVLCMLLISCANIVSPTGGIRDEKAPTIQRRSMVDSAIQFKGGLIQFEFNEFIQLKDIQNQLIITPLLKDNPKITAHKKKLSIYIADSLLEKNTTYSVSMGEAVQDLKEGNPYKNLNFTFSTGNYFDSLQLKGMVYEANSGKPDTSCMVLLYPAFLPDSAFALQKPLYMQKVVGGAFAFKNLPDRAFTIYALQDLNKNYRYDLPSERIAFQQAKVQPKDKTFINLYSFIESDKPDTTRRKLLPRNIGSEAKPLNNKLNFTLNTDTTNRSKRSFDINDSLVFKFDRVLKLMDINKIRIYQDSILDASAIIELDSSKKKVTLSTQWTEEALYKVILMKGFAQDSSGLQSNAAEFYFRTKRKSDYGFLTVQVSKNEKDIIELLRNDKVILRKTASDSLITFSLLNPDNYQLRVLHDENKNGLWDSGAFFKGAKQAELVELFPGQITIKANWENKIDLKSGLNKKTSMQK